MKIAILGGGLTGLTAAYLLKQKNHQVVIFEKENFLGGLASGFKKENWDWYLDKTYHHLFASDNEILNFAKEIGFNKIFFQEPITSSLYKSSKFQIPDSRFKILPMDTPLDFLKFPYLNFWNKMRAGLVIALLKYAPLFSLYEQMTAEDFLIKTMGKESWNVLWQQLFRKKFGKYAGNISASFIWARINKRTKKLGYIEGGFQTLVDYLEKLDLDAGVEIRKNYEIKNIIKEKGKYKIGEELYDVIISTLPTPILINVANNIFPQQYLSQLKKIKYLYFINLILESDISLLDKTYWLNICDPNLPLMGVIQHTNFIDKKNYGGKHILYVANYVDNNNALLKMSNDELLKYYQKYLLQINSKFKVQDSKFDVFKFPFAQPIYNTDFVKYRPTFKTPLDNFFIANLDMSYPYDRGINYSISLAKKVSQII